MHGESPLATRDRLLAFAVPVVILLIACLAVVRHHRVDQSPWQGFSLGMFSTHDNSDARTVRATGVFDGERQRLAVPPELSRLASRVLVAPGDRQSEELARELRNRTAADRVVVEVWGHEVDSQDERLTISFRVIHRVEVP